MPADRYSKECTYFKKNILAYPDFEGIFDMKVKSEPVLLTMKTEYKCTLSNCLQLLNLIHLHRA